LHPCGSDVFLGRLHDIANLTIDHRADDGITAAFVRHVPLLPFDFTGGFAPDRDVAIQLPFRQQAGVEAIIKVSPLRELEALKFFQRFIDQKLVKIA
jgi:hypothetical protein